MERVESEVLMRRGEYEQIQLRAAEVQSQARASEYHRARVGLLDEQHRFDLVQRRVADRLQKEGDPRLALQESSAAIADLKASTQTLMHAHHHALVAQRALDSAAQVCGVHRERSSALNRLSIDAVRIQRCARAAHEDEAMVEAKAAQALVSHRVRSESSQPDVLRGDRSIDAGPTDSTAVSPPNLEDFGAVSSLDLAPSHADAQGAGPSFHQDNAAGSCLGDGAREHSPHGSVSAPCVLKSGTHHGASTLRAGDFVDHIRELSSWEVAQGAGVAFSFAADSGKTVRVEVRRSVDGTVRVAVAPYTLGDQRTLSRALRSLKYSLEQHGLTVTGMSVGSAHASGPRLTEGEFL